MKKIDIIESPIIFTKDEEWVRNQKKSWKGGDVILLPEDAVLVIFPIFKIENNKISKYETRN